MMALYVPFVIALLSLAYAGYNTFRVLSYDDGNDKMREIAARNGTELQVLGHVEEGDHEVILTQKDITYTP